MDRLTVSSSIVGIIVLVISLAFLHIYTRDIFKIDLLDPYKARVVPEKQAVTEPKQK